MDYAKQYQEYLARANQALEKTCETFLPEESEVCRAARYSLLGGGKRIRAVLVLAVCDMLNGSAEAAEQFAAAVDLDIYSTTRSGLKLEPRTAARDKLGTIQVTSARRVSRKEDTG